jgi:YggT family protein
MQALITLATTRGDIAAYVGDLFYVYWIIVIAYIVVQWYLGFGGRVPYSRWSSALLTFLREVVEPYLRIFRRFIPPLGGLDLSPMLAIFLLFFMRGIVVNLIAG